MEVLEAGGVWWGPEGLLQLMAGLVYFPCDSEEKLLTNGKLMKRPGQYLGSVYVQGRVVGRRRIF